MKTIFISTPYPIVNSSSGIAGLINHVKEELGIDINIIPYEWEEDNQTGTFEVEEENWYKVVKSIHEYGDAQCFHSEPICISSGWANCIDL